MASWGSRDLTSTVLGFKQALFLAWSLWVAMETFLSRFQLICSCKIKATWVAAATPTVSWAIRALKALIIPSLLIYQTWKSKTSRPTRWISKYNLQATMNQAKDRYLLTISSPSTLKGHLIGQMGLRIRGEYTKEKGGCTRRQTSSTRQISRATL